MIQRPRRALPGLMAIAFGLLAVPPLAVLLIGLADPTFRPGNFPSQFLALTGVAFGVTALAWRIAPRDQLSRWWLLATTGSLWGLFIGLYGGWGISVLLGDCLSVMAVAQLASSLPEGYCSSQSYATSLLIGVYLVVAGAASVASLIGMWWLGRERKRAALD